MSVYPLFPRASNNQERLYEAILVCGNLLDRAEHNRRDLYLAAAVDLCELERRMRSIGTDD